MKFYEQSIVQKIRKKRRAGYSTTKLEKEFGVPNSTISRWVRDIPSNFQTFNSARKQEQILKSKFQNLIDKFVIDDNIAKIIVSLMYWCAGSKYPSSNFLAFSNSDFYLVKTFLELLRQGFKIKEDKIRAHLQIHSIHSPKRIMNFWSKLLRIPLNQFYKPTVTEPTRSMKRLNYKGTCTIRYYDVKLLLQIIGLYENLIKKLRRGTQVRLKGGVC